MSETAISMVDVIEQCRAYRDAAKARGDDGTAMEWELVRTSLEELVPHLAE